MHVLNQAVRQDGLTSSEAATEQDVTLSSETYSAPCPGGCLDGGAG